MLRNTSVQSHFACSVHGACNVYPAIVDMSVHVHAQYIVQVLLGERERALLVVSMGFSVIIYIYISFDRPSTMRMRALRANV